MLLAVPLAAAGLSIGALPALAAHATHARASGTSATKPKTQAVRVVIKDVSTGDEPGTALVGPNGVGAKTLFTAHVGRPVVMTVVNHSTTMHSFTAKGLGVNAFVVVGATVTVKFTPKKGRHGLLDLCPAVWGLGHEPRRLHEGLREGVEIVTEMKRITS